VQVTEHFCQIIGTERQLTLTPTRKRLRVVAVDNNMDWITITNLCDGVDAEDVCDDNKRFAARKVLLHLISNLPQVL